MNQWLSRRRWRRFSTARSVHGFAERPRRSPPRALAHGAALDLGGRTVRCSPRRTFRTRGSASCSSRNDATLLCGDLFTHAGTARDHRVGHRRPALEMGATVPGGTRPFTAGGPVHASLLAELQPRTLVVMHGSSFRGDAAAALRALAAGYERCSRTRARERPCPPARRRPSAAPADRCSCRRRRTGLRHVQRAHYSSTKGLQRAWPADHRCALATGWTSRRPQRTSRRRPARDGLRAIRR